MHVTRTLPSAVIEIDAMPVGSLAETEIVTLPLPLIVVPSLGAVTVTLGGVRCRGRRSLLSRDARYQRD